MGILSDSIKLILSFDPDLYEIIWLSLKVSMLALIISCIMLTICFFFRDPIRNIENQSSDLLSPADGKIVAIEKYQDPEIGESIKIAIFLSISF